MQPQPIEASIYLYDRDKEITAKFKTRQAALDWIFNPKLINYRGWLHDGSIACATFLNKEEENALTSDGSVG